MRGKLPGQLLHNNIDHLMNKVAEFVIDEDPEVYAPLPLVRCRSLRRVTRDSYGFSGFSVRNLLVADTPGLSVPEGLWNQEFTYRKPSISREP